MGMKDHSRNRLGHFMDGILIIVFFSIISVFITVTVILVLDGNSLAILFGVLTLWSSYLFIQGLVEITGGSD